MRLLETLEERLELGLGWVWNSFFQLLLNKRSHFWVNLRLRQPCVNRPLGHARRGGKVSDSVGKVSSIEFELSETRRAHLPLGSFLQPVVMTHKVRCRSRSDLLKMCSSLSAVA